ncbi:Sugar (and other) transporter family protein [Theileria parva strain Muguga]|uniref:Hexose transporter 1 n=1 Tax=Theileria parva TaxID=5875 RepID=Q4N0P9_THEPA|nr:Sugar (and other) transporter family protein [Theileria parva strain Muguga]EAN30800.1 Sugar (and other) transporter family protein [Theileria parva strain Muguga]|eukprot:XP_763083.1 monosaccharide transporter [Theileria parva strain Muguga]
MKVKTSKSLICEAAIGALGALCFGLTVAALNTTKEFAIVDMEWCKGETDIYDCPKSQLFAGLSNGSTFIGAAFGSLLIGLSGGIGRRVTLMIVNWFFVVGCILSTAAVNFAMLFIGRLISGFGIGLAAVIPVFLVEICHPKQRKYFAVIYQLFITFGLLISAGWQLAHGRVVTNVLQDGVTPFKLSIWDKIVWRGTQFLPVFCCIASLVLIHFVVPFDTPYELISKGKTEEAREVIEKLHGKEEVDEVYDEFDRDQEVAKSTPSIPLLRAFKTPKYRKVIIHAFVLAAIQQLVGITILTSNVAKIFTKVMGRNYGSTLASSSMFLVNFISTVVLTFVIGKFGRKTFLVWGIGFSTIFMALSSFSKPIGKEASWVPIVSSIGSFGFIIGFAFGLGGIVWVYLSEVFATEYRDGALSVAVFINWLCASLTLIASEFLISYSEVVVSIILFAFSLFGLVYVIVFIKETKGVPIGKAYD